MNSSNNPIIIIIMGVSGSGKSTIGKLLSKHTAIDFYDGDAFHPKENIDKMSAGHPLDDIDRKDWLTAIHSFCLSKVAKKQSCILACSALKESYRTLLRKDLENQIRFVYLKGSFETIHKRLSERSSHFMPPHLLQSQFDTLEPPKNAVVVDILDSQESVLTQIITQLSI